jgi:hypothetical protein
MWRFTESAVWPLCRSNCNITIHTLAAGCPILAFSTKFSAQRPNIARLTEKLSDGNVDVVVEAASAIVRNVR